MMDGKLLLVRHRRGDETYHLLPGGGVESGETIEGALSREVEEETGLRIQLVKPLFISDTIDPAGGRHVVNITFLVERIGGRLGAHPEDDRVDGVELVDPTAILSLDLRPPMADAISEAIATGFRDGVCYLGSLWIDGRGSSDGIA
jgi:ADP-ribose pyrophosphatase YjhB (NUDIX family)